MQDYDPLAVRADFPLLHHYGDGLSFLDSAASSQKPDVVIDRMNDYYRREHANIHRGLYSLSERATRSYENARTTVSQFIGAEDPCEVIFTRGCTEAINIVARTWGETHLKASSEVIISVAEHHANMVPWQILAEKTGCMLHFIPLGEGGRVDEEALLEKLSPQTALVALFHVSNVLGSVNPLRRIIPEIRRYGARVLVDGAQGVVHLPVDVQELGSDFYVFSSHKMCGPTGVGVLWGKKEILASLPPFHGGGDMIETVTTEGFTTADLPHRLEAGTPPIAEVLGLEAAIQYLGRWDRGAALAHERALGQYLKKALGSFKHIRSWPKIIEDDWVGVVSFHHTQIHAHDLACFADSKGVAVRAGHHCAMPLHDYLKVSSTLRVSPYIYNTQQDIDRLLESLEQAEHIFL